MNNEKIFDALAEKIEEHFKDFLTSVEEHITPIIDGAIDKALEDGFENGFSEATEEHSIIPLVTEWIDHGTVNGVKGDKHDLARGIREITKEVEK